MKNEIGYELIEDLLFDPSDFFNQGKTYDLLNKFFKGLPVETLIPLLTSSEIDVQKSAIWIASELASNACILIPYIAPLVESKEKYIRYYALECVMLCAKGQYISYILYLINSINDDENMVMAHSMKLVSNTDKTQLIAGIEIINETKDKDYQLHIEGLTKLINVDNLTEKEVINMIDSNKPLIQRYGAIIVEKAFKSNVGLIDYALSSSNSIVKEYITRSIT